MLWDYNKQSTRCNKQRNHSFSSLDRMHNSGEWSAWLEVRQDLGEKLPSVWEPAEKNPKCACFSKLLFCFQEEERQSWCCMAKAWLSRKIYKPCAETKNILTYKCKTHQLFMAAHSLPSATKHFRLEAQHHLILTGFQSQESVPHRPGASGPLLPETSSRSNN